MTLATSEGHQLGEPMTTTMIAADYWADVPQRLRDAPRFIVERIIQLQLGTTRRSSMSRSAGSTPT